MDRFPKIYISTLDLDMASVIGQNNRENLYALLKRMDMEIEKQWDKDALALILKDSIMENPEFLLYIYNREVIQYLIYLWEYNQPEIFLDQQDWNKISQLKLLGFIDHSFVEKEGESCYLIHMVKEAKDTFYFYLKSKTARLMMERYQTWETLIRGMMTYYGIISFQRFYFQFCRLTKSPIDDRELHRFLSSRIDLHHFGCFAIEKPSNIEYYQSYEISNPEKIIDQRQQIKETDYYFPDYDDVIYIAENNGIGNWEGISQLAEVFLQLLDIEYYKTVIAIKTCILMSQNDEKKEDIVNYLLGSYPECRIYQDKIREAVYSIYNSVPVYGLKGHSRKEMKKVKSIVPGFTLVDGGKRNRKKEGGKGNECKHPDC